MGDEWTTDCRRPGRGAETVTEIRPTVGEVASGGAHANVASSSWRWAGGAHRVRGGPTRVHYELTTMVLTFRAPPSTREVWPLACFGLAAASTSAKEVTLDRWRHPRGATSSSGRVRKAPVNVRLAVGRERGSDGGRSRQAGSTPVEPQPTTGAPRGVRCVTPRRREGVSALAPQPALGGVAVSEDGLCTDVLRAAPQPRRLSRHGLVAP